MNPKFRGDYGEGNLGVQKMNVLGALSEIEQTLSTAAVTNRRSSNPAYRAKIRADSLRNLAEIVLGGLPEEVGSFIYDDFHPEIAARRYNGVTWGASEARDWASS